MQQNALSGSWQMDENTRKFSFLCSLVFCFQIIYYESVLDFKISYGVFPFFSFESETSKCQVTLWRLEQESQVPLFLFGSLRLLGEVWIAGKTAQSFSVCWIGDVYNGLMMVIISEDRTSWGGWPWYSALLNKPGNMKLSTFQLSNGMLQNRHLFAVAKAHIIMVSVIKYKINDHNYRLCSFPQSPSPNGTHLKCPNPEKLSYRIILWLFKPIFWQPTNLPNICSFEFLASRQINWTVL